MMLKKLYLFILCFSLSTEKVLDSSDKKNDLKIEEKDTQKQNKISVDKRILKVLANHPFNFSVTVNANDWKSEKLLVFIYLLFRRFALLRYSLSRFIGSVVEDL